MSGAPVGANLNQSLDVHSNLAAEITLDLAALVDDFTKSVDLVLGEVAHACVWVNGGLRQDLLAGGEAYAEDVGKGDLNTLLARNINACNTSHQLTLSLLVLWVFANDHDASVPLNHEALVASNLD